MLPALFVVGLRQLVARLSVAQLLEMHWLGFVRLCTTAFAIYFGWAFFNDASFHHFAVKIFKFWNCNGYNPLSYCVMRWKVDFYP